MLKVGRVAWMDLMLGLTMTIGWVDMVILR